MFNAPPPPPTGELVKDFFPFVRVYKDGRVERFLESERIPPSDSDPLTGVRSKDVIISPENKVSARLFLPATISSDEKLPILFYIHGGGFVIESAFSKVYTGYMNKVVAEARVLAISVEYRLAPESPIPACYDDCWTAMKWVESHAGGEGQGTEPWINDHGKLDTIFLAGDSAGANLAHSVMARASVDRLDGVTLVGMALVHPFIGNGKEDKLWEYIAPDSSGAEDPRLNPMAHLDILAGLNCKKIFIFIAEKDVIRERGLLYYEALKKSGWGGELEMRETEGEEHVFHLMKPGSINAGILMNHFSSMFV